MVDIYMEWMLRLDVLSACDIHALRKPQTNAQAVGKGVKKQQASRTLKHNHSCGSCSRFLHASLYCCTARYTVNLNIFLGQITKSLKWADGAAVRAELDAQV